MLGLKENFMRALGGEVPEYVPTYDMLWRVRPSALNGERKFESGGVGKDIFGVEWTNEGSAFEAALPKPGDFILRDIRKWRDVIKFPDFSYVNWESMAKADLANHDPELPVSGSLHPIGFFIGVTAFMGFEDGLIACFEEPEEVKALINYMCDCFLSVADKYLQYYKPDFMHFGDDIAHERNPFVSLEMFRDIFAPVWRRYIKFFKDRGYLAVHHNCGHFEEFLDDVVDMGFNCWEPAQTSNDLISIKKKYGNKLLIAGGFDSRKFTPSYDVTEDECRSAVKKLLDELAPGGGYAFSGGHVGDDPISKRRTEWIMDEYEKLKATYYD